LFFQADFKYLCLPNDLVLKPVLNIETATRNCSVSISDRGQVLSLVELNDGSYSHAENLHKFIEEALVQAGVSKDGLNAIAVSMGPGSYTGLRIGVSAAKGLCFALDLPLIAVPTLELLAMTINIEEGYIVPMLDARRMEVYTAVFNSDNKLLKPVSAEIITEHSFGELFAIGKVHFIGDGVAKCQEILKHDNAVFLPDRFPSAREMAVPVHRMLESEEFVDLAYFEPYYLKDFLVTPPKKRF
jgi:tRNA threonylcarbamoyladenosine biosynthesis protein TsaB